MKVTVDRRSVNLAAPSRPRPGRLQVVCKANKNRQQQQSQQRSGGNPGRWSSSANSSSSSSSSSSPAGAPLFPAKKQTRVKLPALVLSVSTGEVTQGGAAVEAIDEAVAGGATAVLLTEEGAAGGAQEVYEAALKVKERLRGRAELLFLDRSDLATAAGAGVIMSPRGLPMVVAKKALGEGSLVGKLSETPEEAAAAAADGASLILLQGGEGLPSADALATARKLQKSSVSIPLLAVVPAEGPLTGLRDALASKVEGLVVPLGRLTETGVALGASPEDAAPRSASSSLLAAVEASMTGNFRAAPSAASTSASAPAYIGAATSAESETANPWWRMERGRVVSSDAESLVNEERRLLTAAYSEIVASCPELAEVSLLSDALRQLDELFLVVVVGEFNSGKSSVINALLGDRYLAEGILPTTNEISVLKYKDSKREVDTEQTTDGLFVRYLPAPLLRDVNIVDTPGTNVILSRQQRLTEEFVPRADLVLFVMSADRPFTDSEVNFLKYIRQWSKKVVFVLNKADLFERQEDIQEVLDFVRDNAQRVLGLDDPTVLPVSARKAMKAKEGGSQNGASPTASSDLESLASDAVWKESQFERLESFLVEFLSGSPDGTTGEIFRLKLQTPVSVAEALLDASGRMLATELDYARQQVSAVQAVERQLAQFRAAMVKDGEAQRNRIRRSVMDAVSKAERTLDNLIQLSNVATLSAYVLGSTDPSKLPVATSLDPNGDLVGSLTAQVGQQVKEHDAWLADNTVRQVDNYRSFAERQSEALGLELPSLDREAEGASTSGALSAEVSQGFQDLLRPKQMEEDVREVVLTTSGFLGGSAGSLLVLTSIFQTGFEDLLALLISGLLGYLGVVTLPLRRAEVKKKLRTRGEAFADRLERELEDQLNASLDRVEGQVRAWMRPVLEAAEMQLAESEARKQRIDTLTTSVEQVKQRVANL